MKNLQAFLYLIRVGEGTSDENGYRRLFGGRPGTRDKLFDDWSDHPRVRTYEKNDEFIKNGKKDFTTAAGAYQITATTWDSLIKGGLILPDFRPESQDRAACALVKRRGALEDVLAGRFEMAITKCNREWASLPGSPYGQPTLSWSRAKKILSDATQDQAPLIVEQPKEVTPMLSSFAKAAIGPLLEAAPDLIRLFGGGDQSEKNAKAAEKVVEIAKVVTGEATAEGAVNKIQSDPAAAEAFSAEAKAQFLEIEALAEKRVAAAREFNKGEAELFGRVKFVHILSSALIIFSGVGGVLVLMGDFPEGLKGSIVTLMLIGGWTAVQQYWLGSSSGSDKKTDSMMKNG